MITVSGMSHACPCSRQTNPWGLVAPFLVGGRAAGPLVWCGVGCRSGMMGTRPPPPQPHRYEHDVPHPGLSLRSQIFFFWQGQP